MTGASNQNPTSGLSAVPSADIKPQPEPVKKTEVVNYIFKPSGQELVQGKLVYTNKEEGPAWYTRIPQIVGAAILFPFKMLYKLLEIILKTLNLLQTTCLTITFIVVLVLLGLIITILYKPAFVWNPLKTYLNSDMYVNDITQVDMNGLYERISMEGISEGRAALSDSELTYLIRDFTLLDERLRTHSTANGMVMFMNIDTNERPLWFRVETLKENNRLVVSRVGFGRFDTPNELAGFLNDTVGIVFSIIEQQVTAENYLTFFDQIINETKLDRRLHLSSVELKEGSAVLYFEVDEF